MLTVTMGKKFRLSCDYLAHPCLPPHVNQCEISDLPIHEEEDMLNIFYNEMYAIEYTINIAKSLNSCQNGGICVIVNFLSQVIIVCQ